MGQPIEQSPAALSLRESRAFGDRLISNARGSGKRAVFSVDEETGEVLIGGAEDTGLRQAAEQAANGAQIKIRFDPSLQIVETDNAIAGEEFNGDGTTTESNVCTTGFAVYNVTYGITTAGHCQNAPADFNIYTNTRYGSGNKLTFKAEYKSGTDVQWHGLAETNDQTAPYYWNGSYSTAIETSLRRQSLPDMACANSAGSRNGIAVRRELQFETATTAMACSIPYPEASTWLWKVTVGGPSSMDKPPMAGSTGEARSIRT